MLSGKTNTVDTYSIVDVTQTRNSGEHVKVYGVIDDTEACGAMDTLPFEPYTWNFDIGGGRFDAASEHLLKFYKVKSLVYDPYNRSPEHNRKVLAEIKEE